MFGICVSEIFGNCQILHKGFWLIQIIMCPDLKISMENSLGIFLAEA